MSDWERPEHVNAYEEDPTRRVAVRLDAAERVTFIAGEFWLWVREPSSMRSHRIFRVERDSHSGLLLFMMFAYLVPDGG